MISGYVRFGCCVVCLAVGLLPASGESTAPAVPLDRAVPQSVQLAVRDCPVNDVLRMLCACLGCRLFTDPELDDQVTLTVSEGSIEAALARVLRSTSYMITWKRELGVGGLPVERIESITVFSETNRAAVSLDSDETAFDPSQPGRPDREATVARVNDYLNQKGKAAATVMQHAIGRTADRQTLGVIRNEYEKARSGPEREKILNLVRTITSRDTESGLIGMAGPVTASPDDPLERAAIQALANLGTAPATDHLLERLERADSKESERVAQILQSVTASPASVEALRRAAAGSKRFPSEKVRLAAVLSLGRFQDRRTMDLLNKLATDSNAAIRTAAEDVLKEGAEE